MGHNVVMSCSGQMLTHCVRCSSVTAEAVIEVADVNDNPPQLSHNSYTVTVPELMPIGSSVVTLPAIDGDIGANARLTYTILNRGHSNFFYVDSIFAAGTGVVRIKEVTCSYTIECNTSNTFMIVFCFVNN